MTDPAEQLFERMLVLRCQTGDEAAFCELVERYDRRLRYYLRAIVRDAGQVDDLLQEVWFDIFRALPRLVDAAAFPAWAYRIARDRAVREFRKRRQMQVPVQEHDAIADDEDDVGFSAEEVARIHAALATLAPEHREVLVLRFMDEMSYEQIAAVTCCPLGTVRSRIHYAKGALRRSLEKEQP
jgi:RNA polymerase sigma-70 factor (ECF subfamily)